MTRNAEEGAIGSTPALLVESVDSALTGVRIQAAIGSSAGLGKVRRPGCRLAEEQEADLVSPEAVTGEARPEGGGFALLDPLLRSLALVVEADEGAGGPGQAGDDEAHPRKEFPKPSRRLTLGILSTGKRLASRILVAASGKTREALFATLTSSGKLVSALHQEWLGDN